MTAIFSPCSRYRYRLERDLGAIGAPRGAVTHPTIDERRASTAIAIFYLLRWLEEQLTMTTDIRAALHTIADEIERCNFASATEKLRAILDAPPTVAELLVGLPEPVDGRGPGVHRVEWEHDGSRFRAYRFGIAGLIVEGDPAGAWSRMSLNHADLTQPARLVEATP